MITEPRPWSKATDQPNRQYRHMVQQPACKKKEKKKANVIHEMQVKHHLSTALGGAAPQALAFQLSKSKRCGAIWSFLQFPGLVHVATSTFAINLLMAWIKGWPDKNLWLSRGFQENYQSSAAELLSFQWQLGVCHKWQLMGKSCFSSRVWFSVGWKYKV